MTEPKRDAARSRDDRHPRELVGEARAWMQAEGIEEKGLNWEALAREERALWWRDRLWQALGDLAARAGEFPEAVAAALRRLGEAAQARAEAAVEVTLDAARGVGRVLFEPARECVAGGLRVAPPRPARGRGRGGPRPTPSGRGRGAPA